MFLEQKSQSYMPNNMWLRQLLVKRPVYTISNAILSQGNEYPVTPKANVMRANTNPEIQVTSLGFLKPPVKYTLPT